MKLNRVIIYVADPLKCAAFYRDHFSLRPVGQWSSGWAELEGEGCNLGFHQALGSEGPVNKPTGSPLNPHKICFLVADVPAAREKLVAAGIPMAETKNLDGWLLCNGTDIEGHTFQLTNR